MSSSEAVEAAAKNPEPETKPEIRDQQQEVEKKHPGTQPPQGDKDQDIPSVESRHEHKVKLLREW